MEKKESLYQRFMTAEPMSLVRSTLFVFLCLLVIYIVNFHGGVSDDQGVWGAFGDFMGGVMNPIIGLYTLYILVQAYRTQRQELKETTEALQKTEAENRRTADAQEKQLELAKFQVKADELIKAATMVDAEMKADIASRKYQFLKSDPMYLGALIGKFRVYSENDLVKLGKRYSPSSPDTKLEAQMRLSNEFRHLKRGLKTLMELIEADEKNREAFKELTNPKSPQLDYIRLGWKEVAEAFFHWGILNSKELIFFQWEDYKPAILKN